MSEGRSANGHLRVFNLRGAADKDAPYEVEVRYRGSRYIVRAGAVVEMIYGSKGDRAEPTNLSRDDYEAVLHLAKTNPIRISNGEF